MRERRHRILLYPEPKLILQQVAKRFLRKLEKCGFCAFFDADGTLFDALPIWLRYLNEAWGTGYKREDITTYDFSHLEPPHSDMPGALEVLGPAFRDPKVHLEMGMMSGAPEAMREFSALGVPIVIDTKRPIEVYRATKEALQGNGIPFDLLILSSQKIELALALSCALSVEDNPLYAQEFAKARILSLLVDAPYNRNVNEKVIRILSWREAVNAAKTVKFLRETQRAVPIFKSGTVFLLGVAGRSRESQQSQARRVFHRNLPRRLESAAATTRVAR